MDVHGILESVSVWLTTGRPLNDRYLRVKGTQGPNHRTGVCGTEGPGVSVGSTTLLHPSPGATDHPHGRGVLGGQTERLLRPRLGHTERILVPPRRPFLSRSTTTPFSVYTGPSRTPSGWDWVGERSLTDLWGFRTDFLGGSTAVLRHGLHL